MSAEPSSSTQGPLARSLGAFTTWSILLALVVALVGGVAPNISTQLRSLGESLWPGYASELRVEPTLPTCDAEALAARLAACVDAPGGGDPFEGDDPFADDDPFAEPAQPQADPFADEDPFAEPAAAPAPADPFADEDPFADQAAAPTAPAASCAAVKSLHAQCVDAHRDHADATSRITPAVRRFRLLDDAVGALAGFAWWRHLLSLLLLVGGLTTTLARAHIALRDPRSLPELRISQGSQLVAHVLLMASSIADWRVQAASTAEVENHELSLLWALGFGLLAAVNTVHLVRPPAFDRQGTTLGRGLMVVPLYAWMALIAGAYFLGVEQHPSGQAIYLHKFVQHPTIYIGIGLYIWAGMLLAQTFISHRMFALLAPWNLPAPIVAWLVVVVAAVPTAYSGASGIFVIAAGAIIFEQLLQAGASKRLALATTAMSGSLGVVLRPCLVVVLIAILNKQVTTDQLFAHGLQVFALTAVLYLAAMLLYTRGQWRVRGAAEALPEVMVALRRLVPYVLLFVGMLVLYRTALGTRLNEFTAPYMLPVLMLVIVGWDRWRGPADAREQHDEQKDLSVMGTVGEASHHIGALLMVMAGSVGLAGVVERAELMQLVPASLGSPFATMTVLVLILIVVGMTMDALGAVVLVTVSVAQIAYNNGIDPVHFWMTVLVAFELGYLTPPVALNHLLARQVIGPEADLDDDGVQGFWARGEHLWLPMAVMGSALVLVAYVPLLWYGGP